MQLVEGKDDIKARGSTGVVVWHRPWSSPKVNSVGVRALTCVSQAPGPWRESLVDPVLGCQRTLCSPVQCLFLASREKWEKEMSKSGFKKVWMEDPEFIFCNLLFISACTVTNWVGDMTVGSGLLVFVAASSADAFEDSSQSQGICHFSFLLSVPPL